MKNHFQSKSVPRGTRTIWRYLSALFILFTFAIGQMWGAEETLTWAYSGINTACTDPSGITMSSSSATSTIQSSMTASFSNVKTKSDASQSGFSSRLQRTDKTNLGNNKALVADQYVGAAFTVPNGYIFKIKTISFSHCAISTGINARLTISDDDTEVTPSDGVAASGGTASISYSDDEMTEELSGDVTIKIWFWMPGSTSTGKYAGLGDLSVTGDLVESSAGPVPVTGISIAPSPASVKVGKTITLTPTITPSNATDKAVTWAVTSGGTYASVVEATGVVTGLAEGTAVIKATAHDGSGVTQTVTVNVEECPTSGTVFSMNITAPSGTAYTGNNTFPALIGATYVGGQAYSGSKSGTNRTSTINDSGEYPFSANSELAIKIVMDCPLEEGDIIDITTSSSRQIKIQKVVGTDLYKTASKTFTIPEESALIGENVFYLMRDNSESTLSSLTVTRPVYRTITLEYADGVTADGSISAVDGAPATKPTDPTWAHHRFDGWYNGATPYDWTANVTGDLTLTAHWTQLYTISFAAGEGGSGDAPAAIADKAEGETFTVPANTFTAPAGNVFDNWSDGVNTYDPEDTYTVGTANVVLTAKWRVLSTLYAITEGTHTNGSITISPASQEAGETVTLTATPDADYLFSAWEVVKTEDGTDAGVTVTNGEFTMPAFAVTVNATFVADTREKVLYVTNNNETATKENDKLYDALKDIYNVSIVGPTSEADQTNYDLVVLHESIGGSSYNAAAVAAAKIGSTPVLNTKSYFYNDGRFGWGAPNAGQSVKGATLNSSYCNIADHPLFDGVTMTAGFFEITDDAAAKCMQPVGSFTSGKEGYTLATTPNNGEGNGCAIHELTPAQRGASAGKYLMISVSNDKLNALNANGQKLFQNAAAYLIGPSEWTPVLVPTTPEITGTTAYSVGETIELTASATGESAATSYTWYKGATLEAAKEAGAIQAAKTIAENGNVYSKEECVVGDAGTYWCVISNGTDCEANASVEITVSDASYNASFVSAHGTAPEATSGVSYTLPELTESGYVHQGWTANIDVTVDEAVVTAGDLIANGKMAIFGADVTFTAVWKQIFAVTFNLNGQSGSIAPQDIIDGEKATKPADPVVIGQEFGGWFTDAACTEGNEFDFNTAITEAKELFAKWTAFDGCALLYPALSGDALHVGDNVDLISGSTGGSIAIVGMKNETSITYNANGLSLSGGGADVISVTLNNDMTVGTKISVTLMAANTGSRGLNLLNATGGSVAGGTKLGWDDATLGEVGTFSYTVEASDGLEGTNIFRLQRNNSVYLQCVKVESCGAAITYHNLTSEVNIAGKGTVTLGASSVREGYTTTATYSEIDPLYEFVNWTVSGAGASVADATANPATITIGTEDAVVTLNLQLIPEKFTVNYFDDETPMGTEQVELNAHPTAAGIATAKRHYTFEGWAETKGGSVVDLNSITSDVVATINLYAKYAPVDCPTTGYLFSMEFDETKKPAETVVVAKNGGKVELADYATISGGNAFIQNDETSNKDAISTDGKFLLKATKEVMKIELDCALQLGDIIRIPDNNQKYVISTSNAKTGTYQQQTSSQHEFAVTSDWVGVDDIFILYDGSSLNFTQVYVYRPAKFTVSFDLKEHGAAIADLTNVPEGSKIIAPTAPTDEDYTFEGWYKETTLENVWNFAEDVVTANTTLFAKWIDKSDATLKSLKYGSFDIALENDVYEYNIGLPSATVAVPALTAVTNNPLATAAISDATEFDGEGKATSTVEVTPEKEGAAKQTYTVHFTILPSLPQVTVAASTLWDFSLAGNTALQNQTDVVLANMPGIINDENFNAQALEGSFNKLQGDGHSYQGSKLMFTVAEEGLLTIEFSGTNNHARHLQVCTGDGEIVIADWDYNSSSTHQTKSIEIPAGKITLKAFEGESANNVRIYNLEYLTLINRREAVWVAPGELGTVCLKDDAKVLGAKVFEVMGCNASGYMVFDEILSGEIEAGKPYLFEVTRNGSVAFFKTVGAAHSDDEIEVMGMIGTFDGETLHPGTGNYCYFSGRHIWRVNDFSVDITVPAYCCYVNYDELKNHPIAAATPAPGRRRVIMGVNGKDEAQGFENLNASETPMKVMIDGTLYILRGEKVFDATGRLVK